MRLSLALSCLTLATSVWTAETANDRLKVQADGSVLITPVNPNPALANPWPDAWEKDLAVRVGVLAEECKDKTRVNTTLENEKGSYPMTMFSFLKGDRAKVMAALQQRDADGADHAWTKGHDFFWCFGLKGQALKYFFFGDLLDPAYKAEMKEGGRIWTETDPRPSLEYIINLESSDPIVRDAAYEMLKKMWRTPAQIEAMAKESLAQTHENKKAFGEYMGKIAASVKETPPAKEDIAAWRAWWALICAGDWKVFEEYERLCNPNPHPKFGVGTGPVGTDWSPGCRGMRADARNTDNLRGMRETTIYLFAEECGNETVRKIYKDRLRRTALAFLGIGNGEWDSETYLGHTMTGYANLYAFAKDTEVRGYAKAVLDFLWTCSAAKGWRGGWGGPVMRDYGNIRPWCGAAHMAELYFNTAPTHAEGTDVDHIYLLLSGYRPPAAVVALAKREFPKPCEMLNSHPTYSNWLPGGDDAPATYETQYYAETFQLGTASGGSAGDSNGFKALMWNTKTGVDYFVASSGNRSKNICTSTVGGDVVGQYKNLALFLNRGGTPYRFFSQKPLAQDTDGSITFLRFEKTWIAIHPINLGAFSTATWGKDGQYLSAPGAADTPLSGFALEMGEEKTHGDYEAFKAAAKTAKITWPEAGKNLVRFDGAKGGSVQLDLSNPKKPLFWRNGTPHILEKEHLALFQPADGSKAPISLGWKQRILHVEAGGHVFHGELAENGTYIFTNTLAK